MGGDRENDVRFQRLGLFEWLDDGEVEQAPSRVPGMEFRDGYFFVGFSKTTVQEKISPRGLPSTIAGS
jgi:hypothetical protein